MSSTNKEYPTGSLTENQRRMVKLLSRREREVYELMVKGYSNDEISGMLFISKQTVKNHISSIFSKIGVHRRSDLYRMDA
jgi:DNA-binding NarL/FixJ family response regulator